MRLLLVQNKKLFEKKTRGHQTPIMWNICKKTPPKMFGSVVNTLVKLEGDFLLSGVLSTLYLNISEIQLHLKITTHKNKVFF